MRIPYVGVAHNNFEQSDPLYGSIPSLENQLNPLSAKISKVK